MGKAKMFAAGGEDVQKRKESAGRARNGRGALVAAATSPPHPMRGSPRISGVLDLAENIEVSECLREACGECTRVAGNVQASTRASRRVE